MLNQSYKGLKSAKTYSLLDKYPKSNWRLSERKVKNCDLFMGIIFEAKNVDFSFQNFVSLTD